MTARIATLVAACLVAAACGGGGAAQNTGQPIYRLEADVISVTEDGATARNIILPHYAPIALRGMHETAVVNLWLSNTSPQTVIVGFGVDSVRFHSHHAQLELPPPVTLEPSSGHRRLLSATLPQGFYFLYLNDRPTDYAIKVY